MSGIMGYFKRTTTEDTYINTIGQNMVFEAATAYVNQINLDLAAASSLLVGPPTEDYKWLYRLPGGGRMQKRAIGTEGGAVRPYGSWEVALPLEDYDARIVADEVDWAYMTVGELQLYLDNVRIQYINTFRYEMLLKLFKNTNTTFTDRLKGSLTVVPLANGDTVVYPPVMGSETEATDNHYLESGYLAANINDTNNPYPTLYEELVEHFDDRTGGESVLVLINQAQGEVTKALTDFDAVPDKDIRSGDNVDIPQNLPMAPGRIIGKTNNCWVSQYRWMPAGYMIALHLDVAPALSQRTDPAATGIPQGLHLKPGEQHAPFIGSRWGARFGLGVTNRLNGVVMELGTGGTYTIPTAYQ
jgi:hypothetical protein